jgi:small subunit ribosomal protein S6
LATALRDYEMVVVLSPEIGDDVLGGTLDRLNEAITSRGGEVVDVNNWGRRRLAYPIKRNLEGNYVVSQIKLDPSQVSDLEGSLRIWEDVLRHLIVRTDE